MKNARVLGLTLILALGLALRFYHLHDPILDHPAWRQGDEAAIARNFYELRNNIFYPQTDYDGPPPNYVELELQIVPFLGAQLYRVFGVHEIILRLLVIAFSLGTIPFVYALGARLYGVRAGLIAALLFAIAPGAVYYGRAIIPESAMLFFSAGALLFWWEWVQDRRALNFVLGSLLAALAALAKPPALIVLAPMIAAGLWGRRRPFADWSLYALLAIALLPFWLYFAHSSAIAEWHWAGGITSKHVIPALQRALSGPGPFGAAVQGTLALSRMLASTVIGPVLFGLLLVAAFTQPPDPFAGRRSAFFGAWLAALVIYAFAVVTVERVDYYLLPFVLFAVLYAGGALDAVLQRLLSRPVVVGPALGLATACFFAAYVNMLEIHPYYTWSRSVYAAAAELRARLQPGSLIVMGHYDPSVLYAIGRRGWEEDVLLWNVHDMTSAVAKGARYFVAVEVPRFRANRQLYAFMQRYRRVPVRSGWQVYDLRHFAQAGAAPRPVRASKG